MLNRDGFRNPANRALHDKCKQLETVNYYQKELYPRSGESPRSDSDNNKNGI